MWEGLAGHKFIWVSLGTLIQEGHHVEIVEVFIRAETMAQETFTDK